MPDLLKDDDRRALPYIDLGLIEYGKAWDIQKALHRLCLNGQLPGAILMLEHEPVLTFGRHADPQYLLADQETLKRRGVAVYHIDRGGEITAHNPGQLVGYPILPLGPFRLTPKRYVALLEDAVIELLAQYGIPANTDPINPGVWVDHEKVCAIGVRIKERATMHGFALNVCNDLDLFRQIVPCGLRERGVTSMSRVLGQELDRVKVAQKLKVILENRLDRVLINSSINTGLQSSEELRIITS